MKANKKLMILTLGLGTLYLARWRIATWFMGLATYHWLARVILPRVRWRIHEPRLKLEVYGKGQKYLRAGDIIVSRKTGYLGSALTPGYWKHAALIVEDSSAPYIAEMTAKGFGLVRFDEVCHADRVAVIRCDDWNDDYCKKVVRRCLSFEGLTYDTMFTLGVASLYCSELVYEADFEHRLLVDLSDLHGLGKQYISPQNIAEAANVFVVWDSADEEQAEETRTPM